MILGKVFSFFLPWWNLLVVVNDLSRSFIPLAAFSYEFKFVIFTGRSILFMIQYVDSSDAIRSAEKYIEGYPVVKDQVSRSE